MRRVAAHFFGEVQGVGFRYTTRSIALKLDLKGYVRNERDGSVFAEFEGSSSAVFTCLQQLTDRFTVNNAQFVFLESLANFSSFDISF